MCGRYALGIRAAFVRYQLQNQGLPVDDAPEDDEVRETYNFPPGAYGLVYRADIPDQGLRDEDNAEAPTGVSETDQSDAQMEIQPPKIPLKANGEFKYQLKAMKWGLIPFWTKRSPDYGSMMRTINCRDDSLIESRGMWNTMKQRKRCLVICQGFYEWLKKGPGGKEKIPHFVKRKDGNLMCFAGLWDCAKYEDSDEKLYTYSIITTDSNKQLNFLHNRMPVILDAESDAVKVWLDPTRNKWSKELQYLLQPYKGELECYPVSQAVGKVGNNSPDFIVPIDSKANKNNIANFFGNAKAAAGDKQVDAKDNDIRIENEMNEVPETGLQGSMEDNAPTTIPKSGEKRGPDPDGDEKTLKAAKLASQKDASPGKPKIKAPRSTTSNETSAKKGKSPSKTDGSQRITNFFVM